MKTRSLQSSDRPLRSLTATQRAFLKIGASRLLPGMPGGERASRSAFTLIEMMVVIVIIALLMALLLPALGRVRTSAKEASVIVEIKQLESAIAAFKAKYGREPPSRFSLYLTQTGWNSDPAMRGLVRQIWPQFDFTMGDPTNMGLGKGTAYPLFWWDPVKFPGNAVNMNAGECLLFFLGGVIPNAGINQVPTGFAKNPQYPFAPPTKVTSREGPFFEFSDISRIKDIDGNGVNEWYDSLPGQSKPYLYFSSYEGQGYRIAELSDTNYTSFVTGLHDVYRVYSTSPPPFAPATPNATPSGTQTLPAQKPQTFQIISPGYDGDYGWGGVYNPSLKNAGLVKSDGKPQPSAIPDPAQYDNLTNFAGGRLNP